MSKKVYIETLLDNNRVNGYYTMTLRDKNGNIIKQGKYEIHSPIHQYWEIIWNTLSSDGSSSYDRVGGGNFTMSNLTSRAGGTTGAMGIVVGTDNTSVNIGDLTLGGYIRNGTLANELSYGDVVVGFNPSTGVGTLTRVFTNNNNTTDPTVNEVGVCVGTNTTQEIDGVVIIRDVPGSSYVVLFEATLTVSYEIQLPFGCVNHSMLSVRHQIARNITEIQLYNSTGTLINSSTYGSGDGAFGFVGDIGNTSRGIVIGNGNASEDFNTYAMNSQIYHGTNSGELFHYESTISSFEWSNSTSNTSRFYLSRSFKNKSGNAVSISEIGLVSNATIASTNYTYLFDRRVLGSNIDVADNESVTLTWAYKYNFT